MKLSYYFNSVKLIACESILIYVYKICCRKPKSEVIIFDWTTKSKGMFPYVAVSGSCNENVSILALCYKFDTHIL